MAVKTITVDLEAYEILNAEKRSGESFSRVIKRRLRPRRTARRLLEALPSVAVSPDAVERLEDVVRSRRSWKARSPVVDSER